MARHRQFTFLPGTIGRFIKKHDIRFDYLEVPPSMICRQQTHPGEKFFILTYRRAGLILKTPYSQGAAVRTWPTVEQSLESLGMDILLYLNHESPQDLADSFGGELEDWDQQWEILKSVTEHAKSFLGPEAFAELIQMAVTGFEMGGDKVWLKLRTCG